LSSDDLQIGERGGGFHSVQVPCRTTVAGLADAEDVLDHAEHVIDLRTNPRLVAVQQLRSYRAVAVLADLRVPRLYLRCHVRPRGDRVHARQDLRTTRRRPALLKSRRHRYCWASEQPCPVPHLRRRRHATATCAYRGSSRPSHPSASDMSAWVWIVVGSVSRLGGRIGIPQCGAILPRNGEGTES
jgi:hypothetical protein